VLNALMRLRQICCDLRLLKMENAEFTDDSSGKLAMFSELLEEAMDAVTACWSSASSRRCLRCSRRGLRRRTLSSATRWRDNNRGAVVEKFQGDAKIPVFLISLKAAAWASRSPARTQSFIRPVVESGSGGPGHGRAHRIGQTRVVTSYKLITRGTVEEKILALQQKKRAIIKATLGGEETLADNLTWEEIQGLFE